MSVKSIASLAVVGGLGLFGYCGCGGFGDGWVGVGLWSSSGFMLH
jgi:hypothetical protein